MKINLLNCSLLLIAIFACEGPMGEPGVPGEKGDKGDPGVKGENELPAMSYSFKPKFNDWEMNEFGLITWGVSELAKDILDNDLVIAYVRILDYGFEGNHQPWEILPFYRYIAFYEAMYFIYDKNEISFYYINLDNEENFKPMISENIEIKVVIISTQPGFRINYKNYNEVKEAFQLTD